MKSCSRGLFVETDSEVEAYLRGRGPIRRWEVNTALNGSFRNRFIETERWRGKDSSSILNLQSLNH